MEKKWRTIPDEQVYLASTGDSQARCRCFFVSLGLGWSSRCVYFVCASPSAQCVAAKRVKGQFNPAKGKKKSGKKKLAEKGQEGEKRRNKNAGSCRGLGCIRYWPTAARTRPEIRNSCSPSGPKRGLSSAQSRLVQFASQEAPEQVGRRCDAKAGRKSNVKLDRAEVG